MTEIPNKATPASDKNEKLPQALAELSQESEAPELSPYVISFARYNGRLCEIKNLNSNKARKAVETFKIIGTKVRSEADFQRYHIDRLPIDRKREYLKLYNGLKDDIDLKEIKLQQDARIFYFDIEPERTLYVVAITQNHFETDKVRR